MASFSWSTSLSLQPDTRHQYHQYDMKKFLWRPTLREGDGTAINKIGLGGLCAAREEAFVRRSLSLLIYIFVADSSKTINGQFIKFSIG